MCVCPLSDKWMGRCQINVHAGCGCLSQGSSLTLLSVSEQFTWSLQRYCLLSVQTLMGSHSCHSYWFIVFNESLWCVAIKAVTFCLLVQHVVNYKSINSVCAQDLISGNMAWSVNVTESEDKAIKWDSEIWVWASIYDLICHLSISYLVTDIN